MPGGKAQNGKVEKNLLRLGEKMFLIKYKLTNLSGNFK
jgi:hypothetical protein